MPPHQWGILTSLTMAWTSILGDFYTTDNKISCDDQGNITQHHYTSKRDRCKWVILLNYSDLSATKPIRSINHEAKIEASFCSSTARLVFCSHYAPRLICYLTGAPTQDTHSPPVTITGMGHTRQGPAHVNRSEGSLEGSLWKNYKQ